jgi:hypothetical protein
MANPFTYESLKLYDYAQSSLPKWFKYDLWTPKEGACLLCDIDPGMAEIDWDSKTATQAESRTAPMIENALLLSKDKAFFFLPRHYTEEHWRMAGPAWNQDASKLADDEKYVLLIPEKQLEMDAVEAHLQRVWELLKTADDAQDESVAGASPRWFIEWAVTHELVIPWLGYAKEQGLIDTPAVEYEDFTGYDDLTDLKSRGAIRIDQIRELREAAVNMAIERLVSDHVPEGRITVTRICGWLLETGRFSNGEPFSSRWTEPEGMLDYLKGKDNPLADFRYLAAKPEKPPTFES